MCCQGKDEEEEISDCFSKRDSSTIFQPAFPHKYSFIQKRFLKTYHNPCARVTEKKAKPCPLKLQSSEGKGTNQSVITVQINAAGNAAEGKREETGKQVALSAHHRCGRGAAA